MEELRQGGLRVRGATAIIAEDIGLPGLLDDMGPPPEPVYKLVRAGVLVAYMRWPGADCRCVVCVPLPDWGAQQRRHPALSRRQRHRPRPGRHQDTHRQPQASVHQHRPRVQARVCALHAGARVRSTCCVA